MESSRPTLTGLGLLPLATRWPAKKTLRRASATHLTSGHQVTGYEIHHGRTETGCAKPLLKRDDGEIIGAGSVKAWSGARTSTASFDADEFRRWFVDRLRVRKHLPALGKVCARYDLEPAFDRLAGIVRRSLRMDEIYRLMRL